MSDDRLDTITRCPKCWKLVGARWHEGIGWKTYQHADTQGEPYCEGGGQRT